MSQQQLNALMLGRAAGTSFGVPEQDLGRLSLIAYTIGNPVLAIAAARSMARSDTKPGESDQTEKDPAEKDGAIESAQSAADYAEDAKAAAEQSEQAAADSRRYADTAAIDARNAADVAQKAAAVAQQAASEAQKALEALNAAKSGVPAMATKK
ncbi:hypothetical protein [Sphingomonas sp. PB4P5]|uniref:hypothetical protein n=1 Tax=Parasphingomonas puruogangriensis TaxID=3096155 RepID=UPI002FCC44B9